MLAVRLVGDNRAYLAALELGTPMICIIGFIGEQILGCWQMFGEHHRARDVGGLTGCQVENQRTALFVTYSVNLGVSTSFCATDGLSRSPPFPPPAQR